VTSRRPSSTARFLRRVAAAHGPDEELLRRFVANGDDSAFAELVRRHGPVVLSVCRRMLGDTPDADDAFQAVFLVLARKASRIARPELLGNWLYGVAYRTALRARTVAARRRAREGRLVDTPAEERPPEFVWADLRPVLDEEVNQLPDRYRAAFVLCHVEGRTTAEAMRLLGCPEGTVLSRTAWARNRLRSRLTRRGIAPTAALFATVLSRDALAAQVSPARVSATVKSALAFAAGHTAGAVPAGVAVLAESVSGAMSMVKLSFMAAALAGVGTLLLGAGVGTLAIGQDRSQLDRSGQSTAVARLPAEDPAKKDDNAVSVKSAAPVVVKTVPQAGDTQVDAAKVTEIQVTFSKDMADKSWSWSQISDETFPKLSGKPHYEADKRTCVLPVKLEPGKTYVLWLNPPKFQGFRDADGKPAVFYPLVFQTKN
jgi:RNA polymerase sigma factor (sigma-70 family)